jgi:hypothetical protein
MAPFEMLYGCRYRTPLSWSETGEWKVFGPDILQEAEKQVHMVRENLRVAQSRQKSYADHRRRELSFEVGDFVYLNVSLKRGLRHFKVRGKFTLRYIGPFKIVEKRGEVTYQLELPLQLSDVHDVFHVCQLTTVTRTKKIKMCKVQWSHHIEEEATWEREEELTTEFPSFFSDPSESQGRDSF